ncbi:hypothetical protein DKR42_21340, partial [Salmonella enterica]|nr:hypothetical protein [Salmonella enterica]
NNQAVISVFQCSYYTEEVFAYALNISCICCATIVMIVYQNLIIKSSNGLYERFAKIYLLLNA